jgi:heterodisulfide reductase subunit C
MRTDTRPLRRELLEELERIPDGEKIKLCIQCGTCSGSCPTAYAMDYTPRQIIAAMRTGKLEAVLASDTVWLCASCYSCTVRCPSGIQFTDMMYALKRLGLKHGITSRDPRGEALVGAFVHEVDATGRNPEVSMLARYFLHAAPLEGTQNAWLAYQLWRKGRLHLRRARVKGHAQLDKIRRVIDGGE